MLQKLRSNSKGFTLIELMIVIAIIGILAAIAIPNFIAYRNKAYCSRAESDANNLAAAVADYFSIPAHNSTPTDVDADLSVSCELRFCLRDSFKLGKRFARQFIILSLNCSG